MTTTYESHIIAFLSCVNISIDKLSELDGIEIGRDELLSDEKYKKIKEMIPQLKTIYSSSYMTALQKTASSTHKYPVINILRQVLKTCGYNLNPKRVSNGYTKAGVKLYKRSFVIKQTSNLMQL